MCSLSRMPALVSRSSWRQLSLTVEERAVVQTLATVLDEVEGIEDRGLRSRPSAQFVES